MVGYGGGLKSYYRYSAGMVYNTFLVSGSSLDALEPHAQSVLNARAAHPDSTPPDLYDPATIPPDLVKVHPKLDRMVGKLYRGEPFRSDDERVESPFNKYGEIAGSTD